MNISHDFHRLSHNGFKGLARIERDRRFDAAMVRFGEWLIVALSALALAALYH